jgi:Domain of Unknown Function (DUF928)
MRYLIPRPFYITLSVLVGLIIVTAGIAEARYRPSKRRPIYRGPSSTTGTRGTCAKDGCLTAIAPLSHVGQSQSSQPTIAWFVPPQQANCPGLLTMYRFQGGKRDRLWITEIINQSGLNQLSLTATQALKPGEYIWQLVLECNANRPSKNPVIEAGLGIVGSTEEVNSGDLWYDQWRDAIGDRQKMQNLIQDLSASEVSTAKESVSQHDRLLKLKFD